MKKLHLLLLINLLFISIGYSQSVQSPSEFLGYELGARFTRHHKVVDYFNYVSANSANVSLKKYGETNQHRPLYVSFITSDKNSKNLENIRIENLKRTGILKGATNSEIGIVWLSYNVHGNEASATEAAMLTLYKLITEKQDWLKNTVVIMDPCLNPDGRDRYVNWYNQTKSTPFNTNPETREHNEPWPSGRPNHYLFDLNRDWAWATQIETQQRLKLYNKWMPHIHVDFHEQGYNSPYYFAPAAEPFHEIITDWQRSFQTEIGKNHANYFDKEGWQYFTKERFDLLYPSYGDSYPTFMGAIGMTYEQAGHGRAGLGILTENKTVLTLKDRIAHHTTTGLSTVEVAVKNTSKILEEFSKFFDNASLKYKNYILRGASEKIEGVKKLLQKHEISFYTSEGKSIKATNYKTKSTENFKTTINDLIIPTNQPKGKMVKVLFEQEAKLTSPITYDITAWSLPYAYGLQGFATENTIEATATQIETPNITNSIKKNTYAYLHKWNEVSDAAFLGDLLEEGFNVRFSEKDFSVEGNTFKKGALIIMRGENEHITNFDAIIVEMANRLNKKLSATNTGFVATGADFGSSSIKLIKNKKIAVLSGEGTSSLGFGEIWHFFETQLKYPINVINTANFNRVDLSKYHVLVLPNGYRANEQTLKKLGSYAAEGGSILAIGSAVSNFADAKGYHLKSKKTKEKDTEKPTPNLIPYDQRENEYIKDAITGSIFKSTVDASHPLAFGYSNNYYSLKRNSKAFELLENGYNVAYFPENFEHIAGYAGENTLKEIPNSLLFGTERKGRGTIIYMVDNPLFRSFWENGKLFFVNAVFLN